MSGQFLPLLYTQSGQTLRVTTRTPLVEEIDKLLKRGVDLKSAIEQLMRASGLLEGEFDAALRARILEVPQVRSALERLQALGLIVQDASEQHVALTRLSAARKPYILTLEASGRKEIGFGEAVIGLKGTAELALVATARTSAQAAELKLPISPTDVLHSCQLGGNLTLRASGASSALGVGVGANFALGGEARLGVTWHFQRHADDTVLNSLMYAALDVGQGAQPWDLEDVMRVLDEPSEANEHLDALKAIDVLAERSIAFTAGIEIKRGFSRAWPVQGASGPQQIGAAANLGVGLRVALRRAGRYALRLRKQGGDVILDLEAAQHSSRSRGFDLGVGVDISGVDALATDWINRLLPAPSDEFRALVQAWSKPGTLLKAKIDDELRAHFSAALLPLVPLLTGDASADEVAAAQTEVLLKRWEDALNTRIALIGSRSSAIVDQLMDEAQQALGPGYVLVEGDLQKQADAVAARIDALQAELQTSIDDVANKLKGSSKAVLMTALKPLAKIGEQIDQLATSLDTSAAPLAAAIKRLLARYESLRKALLDGARQATRLKLGLAFASTVEATRGEERALSLRFSRASDSAKRWFSDLMLGRVEIDIDELQKAASASQGAFALESGSFIALASRARRASLTIDAFGVPFGDERLLSSDVRVEVDLAGRVRLLALGLGQSDESRTGQEIRAARLSADFDALTGFLTPDLGVFSLGFELSDNRLKPKELGQFFAGFVDAGVLAPSVADRVRAQVGDGEVRSVQLGVSLSGLAQALRAAAGESREALQREAWENCIRLMRPRADVARLIKLEPDRAYRKVTAIRRDSHALPLAKEFLIEVGGTLTSNEHKHLAREFRVLHRAINAIPDALAALAEVNQIAASLTGAIVSDEQARAARDALDEVIDRVNRSLSPVIDVNDGIFGLFSERLPDVAVALLATLNSLAGPAGLGATPVLRYFAQVAGRRVFGPPVLFG